MIPIREDGMDLAPLDLLTVYIIESKHRMAIVQGFLSQAVI